MILKDVSGEVFQIATGQETSIWELAAMVQHVVGPDVGVQRAIEIDLDLV